MSAVELTKTRIRENWRVRLKKTLERNRVARFLKKTHGSHGAITGAARNMHKGAWAMAEARTRGQDIVAHICTGKKGCRGAGRRSPGQYARAPGPTRSRFSLSVSLEESAQTAELSWSMYGGHEWTRRRRHGKHWHSVRGAGMRRARLPLHRAGPRADPGKRVPSASITQGAGANPCWRRKATSPSSYR